MKKIRILLLTLTITFTCTIVLVSAANVPFQDIWDLDEYTQDNIEYLYEEGIMNGTSSTTFSPHDYYTRSMFVTMLGRMMDVDPADYPSSPFRDVPAGRWDAPYVAWAADNGIVNGIGEGKFNPTGVITLEQYSAIICRFCGQQEIDLYYDASFEGWPPQIGNLNTASDYARDNLTDLIAAGMIEYENLEFNGNSLIVYIEPKKKLTRAWIAEWFGDFHYILNYDDVITLYIDDEEKYEVNTWAEW